MKKMNLVSVTAVAFLMVISLVACYPRKAVRTVPLLTARQQVDQYQDLVVGSRDSLRRAARLGYFTYGSEYFTKNDLLALLAQKGCTGARIYHGISRSNKAVLLIVGVGNDSADLVSLPRIRQARDAAAAGQRFQRDSSTTNKKEDIILYSEVPCPQVCPPSGL